MNSGIGENVESQLKVFNNASTYTATLTGLRLDEAYVVNARVCTRAGCGPLSQRVDIREMSSLEGMFIYIYDYAFTLIL